MVSFVGGGRNLGQTQIVVHDESSVEPEIARDPLPHRVMIIHAYPHIPHQRNPFANLTIWAQFSELKLFDLSPFLHVVNRLTTLRRSPARASQATFTTKRANPEFPLDGVALNSPEPPGGIEHAHEHSQPVRFREPGPGSPFANRRPRGNSPRLETTGRTPRLNPSSSSYGSLTDPR